MDEITETDFSSNDGDQNNPQKVKMDTYYDKKCLKMNFFKRPTLLRRLILFITFTATNSVSTISHMESSR